MLRFLCEEKFLTSFGYGREKTYSVYKNNIVPLHSLEPPKPPNGAQNRGVVFFTTVMNKAQWQMPLS